MAMAIYSRKGIGMALAQILTDVGNAIEGARAHIATFEHQHIGVLRELATQAESVIGAGATGGPEAMIVDLVAVALDDLKAQVTAVFEKPKPAPAPSAIPGVPAAVSTPAPGPF